MSKFERTLAIALQGGKLHDVPEYSVGPTYRPDLPFEVPQDMFSDMQKHLIDAEGMDPRCEDQLWVETMCMAQDLCEFAVADDGEAMEREALEALSLIHI